MNKRLQDGFTFVALMPKTDERVTLEHMTETLDSADSSYDSIILTMPKFDFDTGVELEEGSHTQSDALFAFHGMDGALSEEAVTDELHISKIIHKTTFTLAEAGIEASAATVIISSMGGAFPTESKSVEIAFDRPFYFMLTDKGGEVLFVGKVTML
jgi:serpin B